MTRCSRLRLVLLVCGSLALLLLGLLPGLALAAPADLPDRPLPNSSPAANGGKIVLKTVFGDEWSSTDLEWQDLWTVVQWQDRWGSWHDVTGWQGTLDKVYTSGGQIKGMKSWWVPEELFGGGAFRWLLYKSQDGDLWVQSEDFELPERTRQTVTVEVELAP